MQGPAPDFDQQADEVLLKETQFHYPEGYEVTESDKRQIRSWRHINKAKLELEYKLSLFRRHKEILRANLAFKRPNLINYELMLNPEQTYVLPIFIKPGQTHFFVRDVSLHDSLRVFNRRDNNIDVGHRFYYFRRVIDIREEPVPTCKSTRLFLMNCSCACSF